MQLYWDASALAKRYLLEQGSEVALALFNLEAVSMFASLMGYAETTAILRRKFNQRLIGLREFNLSRSFLEREVLLDPEFELFSVTDDDLLDGILLTDQHNLNTSDAAILAGFLRRTRAAPVSAAPVLVASDRRLVRAAAAEGLRTLDPATLLVADLPAALASLQA